jgi:hypothetical protein
MIRLSIRSIHDSYKTIIRMSLLSACCAVAMMSVGCCGPYGPGCCGGGCNDCDGTASRPIPYGPLDGMRNFKRALVCGGGGCGETYVGEWISTPPDASDPCCGNQFVGGATPCRPFCWQPGALLGQMHLYGQRFCSGAESSAPCGCGDVCGCGSDGFDDGVIVGGSNGCGCASCNLAPVPSRTTAEARQDPRVSRIRR